MKRLNFCLDYLLRHLYQNRFSSEGERVPFDIDKVVLPELGLTNHHEFAGLIDILIEDGHAIKLLDPKKEWLDYYKDRILITPKGIHLLNQGGYKGKRRWDIVKKIATTLNILTLLVVAIIGVVPDKKGNSIENNNESKRTLPQDTVEPSQKVKTSVLSIDTVSAAVQDSIAND
jgi:hypothetical protein